MGIESFCFEGQLQRVRSIKHGLKSDRGWAPTLRSQFGHYTPDDYYESCVESLVEDQTEWIDVGGGSSIFPDNPRLAQLLADRCKRLAAVDPSANMTENFLAHERVQTHLENYDDPNGFSLATMRMVVEHVTCPQQFVAKLAQLLKPRGKAVVYTVNRWAPITLISKNTPMWVHHAVKRMLWDTREQDTFPVVYRMNSRSCLRKLFMAVGFREIYFRYLDDCRTFGKWRLTSTAELVLWKLLHSIRLHYPETCLLGVYERSELAGTNRRENARR
jgi:SAM-dependent methyltransferase